MKTKNNIRRKEKLSYGEYPKSWPRKIKMVQAKRHYHIMRDSVELVEKTLSEDIFRNRYEAAIREAQVVINLCGNKGIGIRAGRALRYLLDEQELLINNFVARCQESVEV